MKYKNKVLTLAAIVTIFLVGCSPVGYMKESLEVYKKNQQKAAQQNLQKREGTASSINIKNGQELSCLVVNENYYAQAHCKNSTNTIRFYTTYKEILTHYNIIHKQIISTNHTNTFGLPNNKIAHLRVWITKK